MTEANRSVASENNTFEADRPACLQNAEWYTLARQAANALHNLYQRVGAVHLEDEG